MKFNDLTKLKSRDELGAFLNQHNLIGEGVEVGVLNGVNSRAIISQWNGQRLYCVDLWGKHDKRVYQEPGDHGPDFEACLKEVRALAQEFEPRVVIMPKSSLDAAGEFEDESLSFCYVDGCHQFCSVISDVMAWWQKLAKGSILGAHDFYDSPPHKEVKRALTEWNRLMELPMHHTPSCGSVWFVKE